MNRRPLQPILGQVTSTCLMSSIRAMIRVSMVIAAILSVTVQDLGPEPGGRLATDQLGWKVTGRFRHGRNRTHGRGR